MTKKRQIAIGGASRHGRVRRRTLVGAGREVLGPFSAAAAVAFIGVIGFSAASEAAGLGVGVPTGHLSQAIDQPLLRMTGARTMPWNGSLPSPGEKRAYGRKGLPLGLVYMEDSAAALACRNGLLSPLGAGDDPCLRPAPALRLVLAWDSAHLPALRGWASFWDMARYPGRRGLPRDPRGTLEVALLADGVAPADLYRVLETPTGVDRAFRRLDQLRPYIAWWTSPAHAADLLGGGAVMTCVPAGEIITTTRNPNGRSAQDPHAPRTLAAHTVAGHPVSISWDRSLIVPADWGIPAALPKTLGAQARKLIETVTDPARVSAFDDAYPQQPPDAPAGAQDKVRPEATVFWRSHATALRQRFDAWLADRP